MPPPLAYSPLGWFCQKPSSPTARPLPPPDRSSQGWARSPLADLRATAPRLPSPERHVRLRSRKVAAMDVPPCGARGVLVEGEIAPRSGEGLQALLARVQGGGGGGPEVGVEGEIEAGERPAARTPDVPALRLSHIVGPGGLVVFQGIEDAGAGGAGVELHASGVVQQGASPGRGMAAPRGHRRPQRSRFLDGKGNGGSQAGAVILPAGGDGEAVLLGGRQHRPRSRQFHAVEEVEAAAVEAEGRRAGIHGDRRAVVEDLVLAAGGLSPRL